MIKALKALFKTEWKLAIRGMDMVIFALVMPAVVMIILGLIYGGQPAYEGAPYTFVAQSFGAVASIGICAAGVMQLPLVLSDYRSRKILKRFRTTPVHPGMLLFVQAAVNALFSILSMLSVYIVAALFFQFRLAGSWLIFLGAFVLVLLCIYSVGLLAAAVAPNQKIANLLCCVLYFPMLLLSGATLPYEILPPALQNISDVLPLTQGIKLLKSASLGLPVENVLPSILMLAALILVCVPLSIRLFRWE